MVSKPQTFEFAFLKHHYRDTKRSNMCAFQPEEQAVLAYGQLITSCSQHVGFYQRNNLAERLRKRLAEQSTSHSLQKKSAMFYKKSLYQLLRRLVIKFCWDGENAFHVRLSQLPAWQTPKVGHCCGAYIIFF